MTEPDTDSIHPDKAELQAAYALMKGVRVPKIPDIVMALRTELAAPDPDSKKVSDLIAQDPGLSGELIRLINSPLYGGVSNISSIHQAVVRMGMQQVINVVTAETVKQTLGGVNSRVHNIWESLVETANAAMSVARLVDDIEPDEAYLLGMMHDVGTLILGSLRADYGQVWDLNISAPVTVLNREQGMFGTNHTVLGYLLAHHWKIPDPMPSAIYLHHRTDCAGISDSRLRAMIAVIKLASVLRHLPLRDMELPEMIQYRMAAQRELMIPRDDWDQLCREATAGFV
jgi:HD-like signal output (HDOD) protein